MLVEQHDVAQEHAFVSVYPGEPVRGARIEQAQSRVQPLRFEHGLDAADSARGSWIERKVGRVHRVVVR